jgi:hypothetical protein
VTDLHTVRITGLRKGTAYRYRIFQQALLSDEGNKRMIFGEARGIDILKHAVYKVTTLDQGKAGCRFSMVNDIHGDDALFQAMTGGILESKVTEGLRGCDLHSTSRHHDTSTPRLSRPFRAHGFLVSDNPACWAGPGIMAAGLGWHEAAPLALWQITNSLLGDFPSRSGEDALCFPCFLSLCESPFQRIASAAVSAFSSCHEIFRPLQKNHPAYHLAEFHQRTPRVHQQFQLHSEQFPLRLLLLLPWFSRFSLAFAVFSGEMSSCFNLAILLLTKC